MAVYTMKWLLPFLTLLLVVYFGMGEKEEMFSLETMPCQAPKKEGDSTTGKLVRKPDGTLWLMCEYTNHRVSLKEK